MKNFTKYIFESRHFSVENKRVKPTAFVPWPYFECSVANIESLEENEIWPLGDVIGNENRGKAATARGDFDEIDLSAARLSLQNAEPPERHWHIIGWDTGSKDTQKAQALEFAPLVELHVR